MLVYVFLFAGKKRSFASFYSMLNMHVLLSSNCCSGNHNLGRWGKSSSNKRTQGSFSRSSLWMGCRSEKIENSSTNTRICKYLSRMKYIKSFMEHKLISSSFFPSKVGCCGGKGSEDFIAVHKPVPYECRDRATGSEYRYGCQQTFAWWLEPWTGFLAGVSVTMMVADVFGIWGSQKLRNLLGQYNREQYQY